MKNVQQCQSLEKMQIKTTIRYYLIHDTITIKNTKYKCWL